MKVERTAKTPDLDHLVEELRPKLDDLEQDRQSMRRSALRWFTLLGTVTLVAAIAAAVAMATAAGANAAGIGVFPLVGGVVWIVISGSRYQRRWKKWVTDALMPEICQALDGDIEYRAEANHSFVKPFNALELIGRWNRGEVQHLVRGEYGGRRFEMVHAALRARSSGKDSSDTQVFDGFLFRIQVHTHFDPGLSIRPNFGWFSKAFGKRAIPTGNQEFDSVFLVSTDDGSDLDAEQLSRALTPDWQDALLALHEELGTLPYGQPRLRAGFKYDTCYLALTLEEEGCSLGPIRTQRPRPFPQVGHVLANESRLERDLRKMVADVDTFRRVIDQFKSADASH